MLLSMLVSLWLAQAPGCTKDTDCKGERICEVGVCVSPPESAPKPRVALDPPPPPPSAPAASYPLVVRRDGLVCVQSLDDAGVVVESCRPEGEPSPLRRSIPRSRRSRAHDANPPADVVAEAPRSRFVADVLLHGGLLAGVAGGTGLVLPQLGGSLALGGRFRSGVGLVGLGNVSVAFAPRGSLVFVSLGPALRFGDESHFLLGLGPSVIGYSVVGGPSGSGLAGSLLAVGVFAVTGSFALTLHSAAHVDASGVAFTLGAGFGFGAM